MALTVSILAADGEPDPDLTLTLDAPRVVIGRGRSCEVMLPDSTVSQRHATIQQRGGENVIIDEGSTNGIMVGTERLPARTAFPLRERELVRIGRLWLQVCTGLGAAGDPRQAEAVAREWLTRRLLDEGEPAVPAIRVVAGPDAGASLELSDTTGEYVVGRSRETDLSLAGDRHLSRRHLAVGRSGSDWVVHDLGSKRGSELDGEPLSAEPTVWPAGGVVKLGDSTLELVDPVPEAMAEALGSPDERMRSSEYAEPTPDQQAAWEEDDLDEAASQQPADAADGSEDSGEAGALQEHEAEAWDDADGESLEHPEQDADRPGIPTHLVETVVILLALAVLGVSIAGLVWVLGP